jgi:hypothetical protein
LKAKILLLFDGGFNSRRFPLQSRKPGEKVSIRQKLATKHEGVLV